MQKFKYVVKPSKRFHRETDGNAMVFVVLVLFTLVCFLVFTIHIGQRFTNKVAMQNAADAAVISGATWIARGFNTISILNVTMSECLALIVMFMAFDSTVQYTEKVLSRNYAEAAKQGLAGKDWTECIEEREKILNELYKKINEEMKKTWQQPETLSDIMSSLRKVSDAVSLTANKMAYLEASKMAALNGADEVLDGMVTESEFMGFRPFATLWPYLEKLPVEIGTFDDLWAHTIEGGQGYANFLHYQNAFDVEVVEDRKRYIDSEIEDLWKRLASCTMDGEKVKGIILDKEGRRRTPLEEYGFQKEEHLYDSSIKNVAPLALAYNPALQILKYTSLVRKLEDTVSSTYFFGNGHQPILSLKSDISGEMITYGENGNSEKRQGSIRLPKQTWAVAAAEVYNPGEKDLFNQNWRVKLSPVDYKGIWSDYMGCDVRIPGGRIDSRAAEQVLLH